MRDCFAFTLRMGLFLACFGWIHSADAYIDMPAQKLTLPRLVLEFRTAGLYRIDWIDPERRAVRYRLVEVIQGSPAESYKHILSGDGKLPEELKEMAEGDEAVVFGPDQYGRGIALLRGLWYVSNLERDTGWWRIAYTASHYDFNCAYTGSVEKLVECCKALLDGKDVAIPCRRKPKELAVWTVRGNLREPHRRWDAATQPAEKVVASLAGRPTGEVLEALDSEDAALRIQAARILGEKKESSDEVVVRLVKVIDVDKDDLTRRAAAVALGRMGKAASKTVPSLLAAARDGYENAQDLAGWEAARAIVRIDGAGDIWMPLIEAQARDQKTVVRRRAVELIGILGPDARRATPILLRALGDVNNEIRYYAIGALDKIAAEPAMAAPTLVALLGDKGEYIAEAVTNALRHMGNGAAVFIAKGLDQTNGVEMRRRAASLLNELGGGARPARGALEKALADPDEQVRKIAVKVAAKLKGAG